MAEPKNKGSTVSTVPTNSKMVYSSSQRYELPFHQTSNSYRVAIRGTLGTHLGPEGCLVIRIIVLP